MNNIVFVVMHILYIISMMVFLNLVDKSFFIQSGICYHYWRELSMVGLLSQWQHFAAVTYTQNVVWARLAIFGTRATLCDWFAVTHGQSWWLQRKLCFLFMSLHRSVFCCVKSRPVWKLCDPLQVDTLTVRNIGGTKLHQKKEAIFVN